MNNNTLVLPLWNNCFRTAFKSSECPAVETYDLETENNHNFFANGYLVHNSGKDIACLSMCVRECLRYPGFLAFYMLPTTTQAKRVIWNGVTNDGQRFLSLFPPEFVESMNASEMRITFTNGSQLLFCGSDNYNSLLGTNAKLMIFSEWAVSDETAWSYLKPILMGNGGKACFISTPRGHTHFWEMYKIASKLPNDWYVSHLNVEQTQHIPLELIQREIDSGETSLDLARQEFWTSFDLGVEGAFYTRIIDGLRLRNQITSDVMYDPGLAVHLSFDLGINDPTCIIFFQVKANAVYVIDYFQASDQSLEDIAKLLREKGYNYGSMFVPHDARNREQGTSGGVSRIESAARLGMRWSVLPGLPFEDGIEATRASLPRWWINETRCAKLISCLENYRREYNEDLKAYSSHPLHNWACHGADAARYLAISLPRTNKSTTAAELDKRYYETVYGQSSQLPPIFRNDTPKGIF